MKIKSIAISVILVISITGIIFILKNREQPVRKIAVGLQSPLFELQDTNGKLWRLADLRGKVVLLNFWASWCQTCKEELPSIQNLINANKDNNALLFMSVLYNDDPANALSYLKANGFAFPVLIDSRNTSQLYGITGVPETFVIDKKGIIRQKVVGPLQWDSPDVKAVLTRLENE